MAGFEASYGGPPAAIVRAPGRVNLIGEHIDYCGLRVLPLALERAVWFAFRPVAGPRIRVCTDARRLEPLEFDATTPIPPGPAGDWGNYVRAAVEAVAVPGDSRGFDASIAADLPVASGLSSSSALVVASALAWIASNDREEPDRLWLAARLAEGERYVGTAGGGMDQAASLLGRAGHAIAIAFNPLAATPIPIPDDWRIVIGHSGVVAEKSGAAQAAYNARTREAALAGDGVAAELGADGLEGQGLGAYPALVGARPAAELFDVGARALEGPLASRFRHIVSESGRVTSAIACARSADLVGMGALLDESHASLREDYEVSTPALDALVDAARAAGASGARLTGAGLGGCALALCDASSVDNVLDAMRRFEAEVGAPRAAFVARAAEGARLMDVFSE
ncbi:MAG: galactokinase [Gemmatimonadota bacterium]